MTRDAADDWRRYDPAAIPTKHSTPALDRFVAGLGDPAAAGPILDVGCGTGRLARGWAADGFTVVGVDVNPAAIAAAAAAAGPETRFFVADVAAADCPPVEGGPFAAAVCQLVVSIVGDARRRANLLRNVRDQLRPGAALFLSASGVSDAVNPGYARQYAADFPLTGERHSYLSRDGRGEVLYMTHHFTAEELERVLARAGFDDIAIETLVEASSRRPDEAAVFHYATCRRGRKEPGR